MEVMKHPLTQVVRCPVSLVFRVLALVLPLEQLVSVAVVVAQATVVDSKGDLVGWRIPVAVTAAWHPEECRVL
jgi:hypothetical protein